LARTDVALDGAWNVWFGLFFLVTAVARLVSLYSSGASPAPEPEQGVDDVENDG